VAVAELKEEAMSVLGILRSSYTTLALQPKHESKKGKKPKSEATTVAKKGEEVL
jgi:hypothetical protein